MKKTQILREDFDTSLAEHLSENSRAELEILEDYSEKIADLNKLALGWAEEYTDVINMEDELANVKANFINTDDFKVTLGGTPITFVKSGKTYKAQLGGIDIRGALKHKLVAHLTHGVEPVIVDISGTPAVKYLIQYGTYALEIYVFKNGNSFFKKYLSAKQNKRKNSIHRAKTYSYEEEDKINGGAFPQIELDTLERALELVEELENLSFKSEAVRKMLDQRTNYVQVETEVA